MSLPILTFEEGALSPSLGYVFNAKWVEPYESILGILWKFARVNALPGHLLVPQLTPHVVDPYTGLTPNTGEVPVRRVAKQLGILQKTVRASLAPQRAILAQSPVLRYCRRCLNRGYHGIIHHRLGADQCPIHGDWLEEVCRNCDKRMDYRLNAFLLDAPFRCGHCRQPIGQWHYNSHRPLKKVDRIAVTRAAIHRHSRQSVGRINKYRYFD